MALVFESIGCKSIDTGKIVSDGFVSSIRDRDDVGSLKIDCILVIFRYIRPQGIHSTLSATD